MSRRPLLVLPTLGLEVEYLDPLGGLVSEPYVLSYSRFGGVARWIADAEAAREALGLPSWDVFGHGLGGLVAQRYALEHPTHVERLILCATAPSLGPFQLGIVPRGAADLDGGEGRLDQIVAPTLIIHGRKDPIIPVEDGGHPLLEGVPDAEMLVFERSGHFPFREQAASFAMALDNWLTVQRPPAPATLA